VLSPSKVGVAEKSSIRYGRPDQAEYPAPPILYLITIRPSKQTWEYNDFVPEVK